MRELLPSICVCIASFLCLVWLLRRDRVSLGLPIAYLLGVLMIHVPGAYVYMVSASFFADPLFTEIGIRLTAVASVCFVAGVWFARAMNPQMPMQRVADRRKYTLFCLLGGWLFVYCTSFLGSIPTLGAALDRGATVWMLGVLLGLRAAVQRGDIIAMVRWVGALAVYPILMLFGGGFLGYGATASIIVFAVLAVSIRSTGKVLIGIVLAAVLGFNVFLNYFANRNDIREAVGTGQSISARIDAVMGIVRNFVIFDPSNDKQLTAVDVRLNQNMFVGLAAVRIEQGQIDYLYGRSVWEGLLALIPRAIWANKTVFGGSGDIVAEMTGLSLNRDTSWGVGNVMEFYVNFGVPGLIGGFILLGWGLGAIDRYAAIAERDGHLDKLFIFYLPGVALANAGGSSMVELSGGAAAALLAAFGWRWVWRYWSGKGLQKPQSKFKARVSGIRGGVP